MAKAIKPVNTFCVSLKNGMYHTSEVAANGNVVSVFKHSSRSGNYKRRKKIERENLSTDYEVFRGTSTQFKNRNK